MLTCLVDPDILVLVAQFSNVWKFIGFIAFLVIPIGNIFYGVFQWITIFCNNTFKNDREIRSVFYKYSIYIGTYLFLTALMITMYIVDLLSAKGASILLQQYAFAISILSCSTPLIIGIIKFVELYLTTDMKNICCFISHQDEFSESAEKIQSMETSPLLMSSSTFNEFQSTETKMVSNVSFVYYLIIVCYQIAYSCLLFLRKE